MSFFKSSEEGQDRSVSNNQLSSVTLNEMTVKVREKYKVRNTCIKLSNRKSQINTQSKRVNHSCNKTYRRKRCTVTIIFWALSLGGGGGQKRA